LDGGNDLVSRNDPTATSYAVFQQADYFSGGQVRVQLPGDSKQPTVTPFPGARRGSEHLAQKGRELVLTLGVLEGNVTHTFRRCVERRGIEPRCGHGCQTGRSTMPAPKLSSLGCSRGLSFSLIPALLLTK
jgi:hypothetical protein